MTIPHYLQEVVANIIYHERLEKGIAGDSKSDWQKAEMLIMQVKECLLKNSCVCNLVKRHLAERE